MQEFRGLQSRFGTRGRDCRRWATTRRSQRCEPLRDRRGVKGLSHGSARPGRETTAVLIVVITLLVGS